MNKLIQFFIPKALKVLIILFGFALVMSLLIKLLPISEEAKTVFIGVVFLIIFPLVSYFHNSIYVPTSLEWILLTPTKKSHIFLAHGLINIFKIVLILLMLLMVSVSLVYYYFDDASKRISKILEFENFFPVFSTMSVASLVTWLAVISMIMILIFGILPNYVQNIQQRQNYQKNRSIKDKAKSSGIVYGALVLLFVFGFEDSDANIYFPWVIKATLFIGFFWTVAVYSTLKSLRYYFSELKLIAFSLMAGLLVFLFLHSYASNDISSKNLHVIEKIESLYFLGAYSSNLEREIDSELLLSLPALTKLTYSTLKPFLERTNRKELNLELKKNWELKCIQRNDFNCRLAYYVQKYITNEKSSAEFLIQSCPKDLGSCLILFKDKEISLNNKQFASEELTRRCVNNNNQFEKNFCKSFLSYQKK